MHITNKTSRTALINHIECQRIDMDRAISLRDAEIERLGTQFAETKERAEHAERKVYVLETDVHNMLGTIRIMADSSREVRVRRSSLRDADIALALPSRNTDKLTK